MPRRQPDPDRMVPVAQTPVEFEAELLAHSLRALGVRAAVTGGLGQVIPVAGIATPLTVMVRRADHDRARTMLAEIAEQAAHTRREQGQPQACPVCRYELTGLPGDAPCPECGTDVDALLYGSSGAVQWTLAPPLAELDASVATRIIAWTAIGLAVAALLVGVVLALLNAAGVI